ncbi:xylose isomerase [Methanomicrobiaceae archaeon CYW5]|uniref:sugar phosphate isomerase/epimerase family protein n=1 Tax=Methanovulcanius yangii TaxID=1789227 RepID=UPI0029CA15C6|nr:sugar phosphate isomerase/epimerase family protein [Methanovulcanius yangii]MBT8507595.1 xylose isomerase [Methanovulcanius yangii]
MLGISTNCLHQVPLEEALEALVPVTDVVEVMDDGLHYLESVDLLEQYSFDYSLHAPAKGVNIASQLPPIRRASVEVIAASFAIAAEVDAPVVIHPGYASWEGGKDGAAAWMRTSLAELGELAEEMGVTFTVENMPRWPYFFLTTPEDLPLIDGYGLCLDVGHAHMNDCLEEFLAVPFGHLHLHDNHGHLDEHLAVGEGEIDFTPVYERLRKSRARCIIEVRDFEGALASLSAVRGHID